jgi:hypothetical protein
MSLRTASSTIRVAVVEALLSSEPRDSLQKQIDSERLWKHGRSSELIGIRQCHFVRGAHDDRRSWIAVLDASYPCAREVARVRAHANEIGDHYIGSRVKRRATQFIDERKLIALIAQHLADQVLYVAVVLDDQDLDNAQTLATAGLRCNFDVGRTRWRDT